MTITIMLPDIVAGAAFSASYLAGLLLEHRMKFDALRIAASIVGLANFRLMSTALHICRAEQMKPNDASMAALPLDAWSIIATVTRSGKY